MTKLFSAAFFLLFTSATIAHEGHGVNIPHSHGEYIAFAVIAVLAVFLLHRNYLSR